MHVNTQVSRGMERLIAANEGARLEGMYGVAGLSSVDTFDDLESLMLDSGFVGARDHMRNVRAKHAGACKRITDALPVAAAAYKLVEQNPGETLDGIFDKIKKAVKKVTKVAAKLSPSHQLIKKVAPKAAMFSPSQMLFTAASAKKPAKSAEQIEADALARARKKSERSAARQARKDAKAAAALARANVATQSTTPADAAAAVLANQSGVALTSPAAQQFAQEVAQNAAYPGSAMPAASMFEPQAGEGAADEGTFGVSPAMLAVGGVALLGVGWLLFKRRK